MLFYSVLGPRLDIMEERIITHNKLLLFGGIYSNLHALLALKSWAEQHNFTPDQIICTGDIGGYCAHPKAVYDTLERWNVHCIAGNVEIQLRNEEGDCGCDFDEDSRCDLFSRQWYPYVQEQVSTSNLDWMKKLPEHLALQTPMGTFHVVHGSYFNTSEFVFKSTPWEKKAKNLDALQSDGIIAGHCGLPFYDVQGDRFWINPGVIGMPANDGNNTVWFATLDFSQREMTVQYHTLAYDYLAAQQDMRTAKLPEAYAKTLSSGIWDNCDILPEEETAEQGLPLTFNPSIFATI